MFIHSKLHGCLIFSVSESDSYFLYSSENRNYFHSTVLHETIPMPEAVNLKLLYTTLFSIGVPPVVIPQLSNYYDPILLR